MSAAFSNIKTIRSNAAFHSLDGNNHILSITPALQSPWPAAQMSAINDNYTPGVTTQTCTDRDLSEGRTCLLPSKYVMVTAVTRWWGGRWGGAHNCYQCNLFVFVSAQHHINQWRQTRMDRLGFTRCEGGWQEVLGYIVQLTLMCSRNCFCTKDWMNLWTRNQTNWFSNVKSTQKDILLFST